MFLCCNESLYNIILENINNLINLGQEKRKFYKCITTDNEAAIINSTKKYYPKAIRISCWFHMKYNLHQLAKTFGLEKDEFIIDIEQVINSLGLLPIIYNSNIDIIYKYTEQLKDKYKNHNNFINNYVEENIKYIFY